MSRTPACTAEQFLSDVADHKMTVLRDDGVDRHLRFKQPDSGIYWFDVITWGGRLYIGGDCGTFVFNRLHDMFKFFRSNNGGINAGYWAEKLEATPDKGAQEFSKERFREVIKEYFDSFVGENGRGEKWAQAKKDELWEEIDNDVLGTLDDRNEQIAFDRAYHFSHEGFHFTDLFENRFTEFTQRYLWNCYAIVWAIKTYDEQRAKDTALLSAHCAAMGQYTETGSPA